MNQQTKEMWLQKTAVIWLGAMLCCALWGSASPCIKLGYAMFQIDAADTASQILFAGIRFTFAGILTILIGSMLAGTCLRPSSGSAWGRVVKLSLLQTVLQYFFFYVDLAHTTGVKASIIIAINVFVAILVASLIYHQEELTVQKIAGCLIGFSGVVLINMSGMNNFQMSLLGEGFIMCSTVAYAFSSVYIKRYSVTDHPVMLSGYQFLVGGVIMMVIGTVMGGRISVITGAGIASEKSGWKNCQQISLLYLK
ncbi:MAG: DMT family transporter [Brotaphodocola sp.]